MFYMPVIWDPTHDIDLWFSRSNLEIPVFLGMRGSRFVWNFWEMNKKMLVKAVSDDTGTIKNAYIFFTKRVVT